VIFTLEEKRGKHTEKDEGRREGGKEGGTYLGSGIGGAEQQLLEGLDGNEFPSADVGLGLMAEGGREGGREGEEREGRKEGRTLAVA